MSMACRNGLQNQPKSARNSTIMDLYQPAERSDEGLTTGQLAIEKFAIGQAVPRVEDPIDRKSVV